MSSKNDPRPIPRHEILQMIDGMPQVSIDLIITNEHQGILLGKRLNRPAQGYWFVPGGRIKKNESIASAIMRISSAETGMSLQREAGRLMGVYDHFYDDNFLEEPGITTHYVAIAFRFLINNPPYIQGDDQHDEFRWWSIPDLLQCDDVHQNTKAYFIELGEYELKYK